PPWSCALPATSCHLEAEGLYLLAFLAAPPRFVGDFGFAALAAFALGFALGFAPARFGLGVGVGSPAGAEACPAEALAEADAATTRGARSATRTVRCAVRFTTRKARPMGAGRIRFCDGPWFA